MRLLLDTHALIWWLTDLARLSPMARSSIADPYNEVHVSSVTVWEMEIKAAIGKLPAFTNLKAHLDSAIAADGLFELDLSRDHAHLISSLPLAHQDPFDRILIAQAIYEGLTIVSRDRKFFHYPVAVLW